MDVFYEGDEVLSAWPLAFRMTSVCAKVPNDMCGPWLRIARETWANPGDAPDEADEWPFLWISSGMGASRRQSLWPWPLARGTGYDAGPASLQVQSERRV